MSEMESPPFGRHRSDPCQSASALLGLQERLQLVLLTFAPSHGLDCPIANNPGDCCDAGYGEL